MAWTGKATTARWARAFVIAGIGWFVLAQFAALAGAPRRVVVIATIHGFVLHVVFGKAYTLLPSYFAGSLAVPWAPAIHFPLAIGGTGCLLLGVANRGSDLEVVGQVGWLLGVVVFVMALTVTFRGNLTGAETGTGRANANRRRTDRVANGFAPVVLGYLVVGAAWPVISTVRGGPSPPDPSITHLLAVGTATLLIFVIGFRLLPRFLVVDLGPSLPLAVLLAGAIGPAILVHGFHDGGSFLLGAILITAAVGGFSVTYADMYRRSDRRRVGVRVVLLGAIAGVATVALGLVMAVDGLSGDMIAAHYRLGSVGFLGLVIIGVTYQFYPPAIAGRPAAGDRLAWTAALGIAAGVGLEALGALLDTPLAVTGGAGLGVLGALLYAYVVGSVFVTRR